MTRIMWVTPAYPPDRGGLSDHSFAMVNALRSQGHEVLVCSKPHESGLDTLDSALVMQRPAVLVVAFVPLGFAPRTGGVSPSFTFWCTQLRKRFHGETVLLAHEACLPTRYHWERRELKLAALSVAQAAQFEILARCFSCVTFSHEGNRDIWSKRMPKLGDRLRTIRICSNIPVAPSADARAELAAAGHAVPARTVLFFGTGHASVLFDYVEAALSELLKIDPQVQLVIVGMDGAKLQHLRPSLAAFGSQVKALGFVSAREVSLWLQVSDLVLGPFVEGVSARKGTVMAAFEHGRAVVTTKGFHTRDDIPWDRICALAPVERSAFAALATRCFQDHEWRAQLGAAARADYEAHASASVSAAQLLAQADAGGHEVGR